MGAKIGPSSHEAIQHHTHASTSRGQWAMRRNGRARLVAAAHVLSQCLRSAALFLGSDLLFHSSVPLPLFACCVLGATAAMLCVAYRPPAAALATHAGPILCSGLASAASLCLWGYGLVHCGPLRTTLFDHSELCLCFPLGAASHRLAIASPLAEAAKLRGALVLLLAYALLLGTHGMHHRHGVGGAGAAARYAGSAAAADAHPSSDERYLEGATGFYDSALSFADSAAGELALVAAAALSAARRAACRRLAADVGPNRLTALSLAVGCLLAAPAAAFACVLAAPAATASLVSVSSVLSLLAFAAFGVVIPDQTGAAAAAWLPQPYCATLSLLASFASVRTTRADLAMVISSMHPEPGNGDKAAAAWLPQPQCATLSLLASVSSVRTDRADLAMVMSRMHPEPGCGY